MVKNDDTEHVSRTLVDGVSITVLHVAGTSTASFNSGATVSQINNILQHNPDSDYCCFPCKGAHSCKLVLYKCNFQDTVLHCGPQPERPWFSSCFFFLHLLQGGQRRKWQTLRNRKRWSFRSKFVALCLHIQSLSLSPLGRTYRRPYSGRFNRLDG